MRTSPGLRRRGSTALNPSRTAKPAALSITASSVVLLLVAGLAAAVFSHIFYFFFVAEMTTMPLCELRTPNCNPNCNPNSNQSSNPNSNQSSNPSTRIEQIQEYAFSSTAASATTTSAIPNLIFSYWNSPDPPEMVQSMMLISALNDPTARFVLLNDDTLPAYLPEWFSPVSQERHRAKNGKISPGSYPPASKRGPPSKPPRQWTRVSKRGPPSQPPGKPGGIFSTNFMGRRIVQNIDAMKLLLTRGRQRITMASSEPVQPKRNSIDPAVKKLGMHAFLRHLQCAKALESYDTRCVKRWYNNLPAGVSAIPKELEAVGVRPEHVYQVANKYMTYSWHWMNTVSKIAATQYYVQDVGVTRSGVTPTLFSTTISDIFPQDLRDKVRAAMTDFLAKKLRHLMILMQINREDDDRMRQYVFGSLYSILSRVIEPFETLRTRVRDHWDCKGSQCMAAAQTISLLMSVYAALDYGVPIEVLLSGIGRDFLERFQHRG